MHRTTLNHCLSDASRAFRDKTAIRFLRQGRTETEISYGELDRDADQMANTLLEMGIRRGDRVVFFMDKSLVFVISHLAVQKIGSISVPLNPGFKPSELSYLLRDAAPALVISGAHQEAVVKETDFRQAVLAVPDNTPYQELDFFRSAADATPETEAALEDPALIIYTSGTTGTPKGVVLTHGNLIHDARKILGAWEIVPKDVLCHALPLFHVHGLCFALHTALLGGAGIFMLDTFSPEHVIDVLSRKGGAHACSLFMAVPPMYVRIMDVLGKRRPDFSHVRLWASGSAPLPAHDFQRITQVLGKEPVEREGMSETGMNFSNPLRGPKKPGSVGLALPGLEVRVADPETLVDVAPGQEGEIWLKGPGVTPGYWRKPQDTAESFRAGWFRTGDLGRVDREGYYFLTDRLKHLIISGGENVAPKEVESAMGRSPDVMESCVVGIPHRLWGEKVVAAVVPKPGSEVNPADIKAWCARHLHPWKCPKEIIVVKELPRNAMGKVLREEVKRIFDRRDLSP